MVDEVLTQLSRRFDAMYAASGRPSIPPEKLLRALLLQMLYSDPQRTPAERRDRLQRAVPIKRWWSRFAVVPV
jgi:transposase